MLLEDTRPYEQRHYTQCPLCEVTTNQWPGSYCQFHQGSWSVFRAYGGYTRLPNLEALRQGRGMTVEELADAAFLVPKTIYDLESLTSRARHATALKLASALGVGVGALTGEEE